MNTSLNIKTLALAALLSCSAWGDTVTSFGELPGLKWEKLRRFVSPYLLYTNDYISNTGGAKAGPRNLSALDVYLDSDLSNYSGINGNFMVHYIHMDTSDDRGNLGDTQVASNIDTRAKVDRMCDLYYQHRWAKNFKTLVGLHDISSEFDISESSLLFLNSSFGTSAEISYAGNNGPSLYPITALGARALYHFTAQLSLRTGIYDSNPGDHSTYRSFHSDIGDNHGFMHISELAHQQKNKHKMAIGLWNQSKTMEKLSRDGRDTPYGIYGLLEKKLTHSLIAFARYGQANPRVDIIHSNIAGGLVYQGIFQKKKSLDEIGLGVTTVHFSSTHLKQLGKDSGSATSPQETSYEFYYQFRPLKMISLRPDVQYISRPSGTTSVKDAWAMGLRTVFEL